MKKRLGKDGYGTEQIFDEESDNPYGEIIMKSFLN
jgi:hypothetical protein